MWAKYLNFPTVGWVSVLSKIQRIGKYLFITDDQRIRGNRSNKRLIVRTMFGGWILVSIVLSSTVVKQVASLAQYMLGFLLTPHENCFTIIKMQTISKMWNNVILK